MNITGSFHIPDRNNAFNNANAYSGAFSPSSKTVTLFAPSTDRDSRKIEFDASKSWTGESSESSPYTTNMGSGTAITINPEHITVKVWKRLT